MKPNMLLWILLVANCATLTATILNRLEMRNRATLTASSIADLSAKVEDDRRRYRTALSSILSDSSLSVIALKGIDGQTETVTRTADRILETLNDSLKEPEATELAALVKPRRSIPERLQYIENLTAKTAEGADDVRNSVREFDRRLLALELTLHRIESQMPPRRQ